jgi:hypothetical protein
MSHGCDLLTFACKYSKYNLLLQELQVLPPVFSSHIKVLCRKFCFLQENKFIHFFVV